MQPLRGLRQRPSFNIFRAKWYPFIKVGGESNHHTQEQLGWERNGVSISMPCAIPRISHHDYFERGNALRVIGVPANSLEFPNLHNQCLIPISGLRPSKGDLMSGMHEPRIGITKSWTE